MAQRQNRWFQPKDGISREVIQADIQRYLGRDATVRPGEDNVNFSFLKILAAMTQLLLTAPGCHRLLDHCVPNANNCTHTLVSYL